MAELATVHTEAPTVDLLDMSGTELYFDEPVAPEISALLEEARSGVEPETAEALLKEALLKAPDDLTVIVAIYRFYYFRHDFSATLEIADLAMQAAGRRLNIPGDWRALTAADIDRAGAANMALLRFYLWALKGAGYLLMRLGRMDEATLPLETLCRLDVADRIGGAGLLALARETIDSPDRERTDR